MTDWNQLAKIVTAFIRAGRPGLGLIALVAAVAAGAGAWIAVAVMARHL